MAQGDGNIAEHVIQDDGFDELPFLELLPDYVIQATIEDGDVRRTLPDIRIQLRLAPIRPSIYIRLVRMSINELAQNFLTAGPEHNPLLSMLAWNADHWSVTLHASGDSMDIAFYPVYINTQPAERVETSVSESSTDDEQPGPSQPDDQINNSSEIRSGGSHMDGSSIDDEQPGPSRRANNSEIRSGASRIPSDQSSGSQVEMRQGVKRKRKTSGSSKSREQKRKRSDHHSDSDSSSFSLISGISSPALLGETSRDDEQPGPSHLVNNRSEIRTTGSSTPADQSSGTQVEMRQGVKRKRKTSGRSESREWKKKKSHFDSDNDQPGPSHRDNSEARAGGSSMDGASTDDEQPGPSHLVNSRSGRSTTPADQSSGSQVEMRQGVKRKRKTSGRSESREWKKKKSHFDSDNDQPGPSNRDNSEARALGSSMDGTSTDDEQPGPSHLVNSRSGRSTTPADQSSGSQVEMRQGVKRKRKTSGSSKSRERKRKRSDHHSDSDSC
ncbi:ABC transporter F family member 4-like [Pimephales promelas]|uniref:ABC transporter F family member 4-like n=1 Tax=Pimephales promelas TaxID=90988 RepID=UPI001955F255|nr:ABC transporter F family member 4-like [Pimephales promelas]